jgi:hypothetical protein
MTIVSLYKVFVSYCNFQPFMSINKDLLGTRSYEIESKIWEVVIQIICSLIARLRTKIICCVWCEKLDFEGSLMFLSFLELI